MVEEQIDQEIFAAHLDRVLASDERKPTPSSRRNFRRCSRSPDSSSRSRASLCEHEKVEVVRVLECLLREVRLRRRQGGGEVRLRFPLPVIETGLDLQNEHVAAPAVLNRLADVPFALRPRLHQVENPEIMPQGICPTTCWTIGSSGQASAKARM